MKNVLLPLLLVLSMGSIRSFAAEPLITLNPGDHICIIGNSLADRMQHAGYLEAMIHATHPEHNLVVRNLGFAGDELTVRMRSEGFGSPDEWLTKEKADVIFAFFGYNESFAGEAGLEKFRADLENFIKHTREQNYSGRGAPRIVLFSPSAAEKHPDPNFPDPAPLNRNLKLYADAMRDVARANGVAFVDVFSASRSAFASAAAPLTINGVHLRNDGYEAIAPAIFQALFGHDAPIIENFEAIRAAVNDKNAVWFSRYRTVDGYNVYGGRSHLEYDGVTNRVTMQREMSMRDEMTANRDRGVWGVAQGRDYEVNDDNLPPRIEVKTNKPGENPDGSHKILGGEEAIARMKVPPGCKVNLFASEEQFPELANPVQMAFDTKGRLWVAAWPNYPERTPWSEEGDKLLIFEDTDNDGRADKCKTFIDDLNCPTGFQFYKDGVILVQAPDVWFVRDTDGDDRADWKERVLNGLDSADSHHTANALALDPGGAIYLSDGVFHRTQVETPWGPPVRNRDAAIYRYEPRASKFETYISYGFANPHGRVFDRWGNDLVTDATGNNTYFGPAFSGRLDFPDKHSGLKQFWERPSRPCPGTAMLSSRHFPEEFQGEFLNLNVIGFQGCFRVNVREEGSGLWGDTIEPPLVVSDDPNFRPIAIDVAPDGSIYFLDWHNPIIGHMQHHLRDPSRDHRHGRVYRITYEGRPLLEPKKIAGEPIEALLELLIEPEDNVRTRAKIELGARDTQAVIAAVQEWSKQFDAKKVEDQHALMEALWVHQWHNVVNEPLLKQMLQSPEPRARAQAVRVLGYWRDRVGNPLELVRVAANDAAPRVRLEAVRVASFFEGAPAMEVAYEVLKHDMDYYLEYTFKETKRQLEKTTKDFLLPGDARAAEALVARLSTGELMRAPGGEAVFVERLERPGLNINIRTEALRGLADARKLDMVQAAVSVLEHMEKTERADAADDLGFLLASLSPADLAKARTSFVSLAGDANQAGVRRAAYAAIVTADHDAETAWNTAANDPKARVSLMESVRLHPEAEFRAGFAPMVFGVLESADAPTELRKEALRALPLLGPDHAENSFDILAGELVKRADMPLAAKAIMQIPRESWPAAKVAPAAESILAWAKEIPAGDRTSEWFIETTQAGTELASALPAADAARIRKELRGLGVSVFALKSVREQMRFDITTIVVEAGKPFEIVFENVDMMPHNVVVMQGGAREEIGKKADAMDPTPDRQGRAFVPDDNRILAATRLVEPGQKETLKMKAPDAPGDYEYVCTYPEHWMNMWGRLVVVKNLQDYIDKAAPATGEGAARESPAAEHEH